MGQTRFKLSFALETAAVYALPAGLCLFHGNEALAWLVAMTCLVAFTKPVTQMNLEHWVWSNLSPSTWLSSAWDSGCQCRPCWHWRKLACVNGSLWELQAGKGCCSSSLSIYSGNHSIQRRALRLWKAHGSCWWVWQIQVSTFLLRSLLAPCISQLNADGCGHHQFKTQVSVPHHLA